MYIVDIFAKNKFSSIIKLDGDMFFKINNKELKKRNYKVDDEISDVELKELEELFIRPAIKYKLVDLLAKKDYSYKELFDKIYRYGYSKEFSLPLLDEFLNKSYIDDYNYCESLIYSYSKKYGINKIKQKLFEKGIKAEIYEEVFVEMDIDFVGVLMELFAKEDISNIREDYNLKNKLIKKYMAKGYTYDEIESALYNIECE